METLSLLQYAWFTVVTNEEKANCEYSDVPNARISMVKRSTVTVVIDCNDCKLKFYLDGEKMFEPIDIIKDKAYHAVLSEWAEEKRSYKLVETTIDISKL